MCSAVFKTRFGFGLAKCLSMPDREPDPMALSLGHMYGCIFGSLAGSPQVAEAGSILFTNTKQHQFGK